MSKENRVLVLIFVLCGILVLLIGTTYAVFTYSKKGKSVNSIRTTQITFKYTEGTNSITLNEAMPITDIVGRKQDSYFEFNISSISMKNMEIPFEITARKTADSKDIDDAVRLYLTEVDSEGIEHIVKLINYSDLLQYENEEIDLSKYTEKLLFNDKVEKDSEFNKTYRLRMWIDSLTDFTQEKYQNAKFSLTINVYSSARNINPDITVDTVEALKASNASVNQLVKTNGYYEANDGGEAYYTIEEKDKQQVDNGMYIELANGNIAELMVLDNTLNLKQFGAKGDGVSDDREYIMAALKQSENLTLFIPKGTYMISDKIRMYSNLTMIGEGKDSLIKAMDNYANDTTPMLYVQSAAENKNIHLSNFAISGNLEQNTFDEGYNASSGFSEIDIWGITNFNIDNMFFLDNGYEAIRLMDAINHISVTNSSFLEVDCGIEYMGDSSTDDALIQNNLFDGHIYSEPITLFGIGNYRHVVIDNNQIRNHTKGTAIFIGHRGGHTYDIQITNNKIDNMANGIIVENANRVIIRNNEINPIGKGIKIINTSNATVFDNKIQGSQQQGMWLSETSNVVIYNNTITNCGYKGNEYFFAQINGTNHNLDFHSNNLIRTDDTLYQYLMVVHDGGSVKIYDNTFDNGGIWLWTDSSNVYCANNGTTVKNKGTNNTVIE